MLTAQIRFNSDKKMEESRVPRGWALARRALSRDPHPSLLFVVRDDASSPTPGYDFNFKRHYINVPADY